MKNLGATLPVYITRKTAAGETAQYNCNVWLTMSAFLLVMFNIIVWSIIGLVEAVKYFA